MTGQTVDELITGKERESALWLLIACDRAKDIKLGLDVISRRFCLNPQSVYQWYQGVVALEGTLAHILKPSHRQAGLTLEQNSQTVLLKRGTETLAMWYATEVTIAQMLREADKWLE